MTARAIAFFDFDGTLTMGDTLMPFLRYVVGPQSYYLKLVRVSPVLTAYFLKLIRNDVAKQVVLRRYLAGYSADELKRLGRDFGNEVVPTMLRSSLLERLQWHQKQGHQCVLVSASLDLYLDSWARGMGFHHVLCSRLEEADGRVTGAIHGSNCHGEEKVTLIRAWLADQAHGETYGYGDTAGDRYMLEYVDHGFWVQGDQLRPVARRAS